MKAKDLILYTVDAAIWYFFIYYWMYVLKNTVDLWQASLVLLVLACAGVFLCPLVYKLDCWKDDS